MNDHTPREGEGRTAEELLDQVLASNRVELMNTMADALDTEAGLEALKPLRAEAPPSVQDTAPRPRTCAPSVRAAPPTARLRERRITVQQAATQPLLSLRTAIVMLAALGIGMVVGCLTVRTGASVEASVLAGLTSAGASPPPEQPHRLTAAPAACNEGPGRLPGPGAWDGRWVRGWRTRHRICCRFSA
jgi:hypothetical protein